jgi:hypothetical protein
MLHQIGKEASQQEMEKVSQYKEDQKEIDKKAREKEKRSEEHLSLHNMLAKGVTIFQVAIAICAISALTKRKWLWFGSIGLGFIGAVLFAITFI